MIYGTDFARVVDLLVPFRKRWLYHPNQNGSASIKKVLPTFTALSYDGMEIGNGQDASQRYADFIQGKQSSKEHAALWQNLSDYYGLNILAMEALVDVLKEKASA